MIIRERPIITWLLNPKDTKTAKNIMLPNVSIPINRNLLFSYLGHLNDIRLQCPDWGLPEMVMPSFSDIMFKSQKSFDKIMPVLYEEFSKSDECGILLIRKRETIVYGFGDNELHLWCFTEHDGKSVFNFYSRNVIANKSIGVGMPHSIITDNLLFSGSLEQRQQFIASYANFISSYVAVKKFVKVETVVIPQGKFTEIDGTPLEYVEKKKVINLLGQEVIVMDSRWFRTIVNDNDIYVRGFWRMQNKKNEFGEWCKELIFVDSFVRHGYHRNAIIEENREQENEKKTN